MPREVKRRHSSSDLSLRDSKENNILSITQQKKDQYITIRKLTVNGPSNNTRSENKVFIPSKIPVFYDKLEKKSKKAKDLSHSQENIAKKTNTSRTNATKRPRLKRSISEKILPLVEVYEKINDHQLSSNGEIVKFLHKRVKQLKKADNFVNEIETPIGVSSKPVPHTPVKVKHRRSKSQKLKSAVNITAQLFQYCDDIIQFYEKQEDERKRMFFGHKSRLISVREWKNSVHNIVTLAVKLHFPPALAYHAIRIMNDLFHSGVTENESPRLLEITALWLITKKEYLYSKQPMIEDIVKHSSYYFTLKQLVDCEWKILQNLNFNINYPDLISIIMYNVKTYYGCDYTNIKFGNYYYVGAFMLDVLLFNRKVIQKSALLIAGVISSFTKILLNSEVDFFDKQEIDLWIPDRIKLSFPEAEKILVIENLISGVNNSFKSNFQENIVFKKYEKLRYNQISKMIKKKFPKN